MAQHEQHQHQHGHQRQPTVERHADVAVIGGSAAGLAAALQLGRQRRSAIVIDSGEPRNAPAAHMHSYLGHEGLPPSELGAIGREEVRSYGGEVLPGRAVDVEVVGDGRFRVELIGGHAVVARRLLVATGLVDELPDIPGLAEHWGTEVIHCPFCHGYEVRDQRLVQVVTTEMGLHPSVLFRQLTARLTIVLHDPVLRSSPAVAPLVDAGVPVLDGPVTRVITGEDGHVASVQLADGTSIDADAVAVGPRFHPRIDALGSLGLATAAHPSGLGDVVVVDATFRTNVPGVFAAGNVADPSQQVLAAAAAGSWAGAMIAFDLADEDLAAASRPSGNQADWEHRYGGERLWSGNPNGSLVAEVGSMAPGRALDVGAGEGGDAVWLAEQGWTVTASDIAQHALQRVGAEATRRGLSVELLHADANDAAPYEEAGYDLVSAQYASIPRSPDQRGVHNLLRAVAPGGTLLVVSHDLAPMRAPIDTTVQSRPHDPDAYVRVEDVAAVLADEPGWTIDVHETRPRPPGAVSTHHVDDVVLRATRS